MKLFFSVEGGVVAGQRSTSPVNQEECVKVEKLVMAVEALEE